MKIFFFLADGFLLDGFLADGFGLEIKGSRVAVVLLTTLKWILSFCFFFYYFIILLFLLLLLFNIYFKYFILILFTNVPWLVVTAIVILVDGYFFSKMVLETIPLLYVA